MFTLGPLASSKAPSPSVSHESAGAPPAGPATAVNVTGAPGTGSGGEVVMEIAGTRALTQELIAGAARRA